MRNAQQTNLPLTSCIFLGDIPLASPSPDLKRTRFSLRSPPTLSPHPILVPRLHPGRPAEGEARDRIEECPQGGRASKS
eukprot:766546-Hanusia_phi.AAC.2